MCRPERGQRLPTLHTCCITTPLHRLFFRTIMCCPKILTAVRGCLPLCRLCRTKTDCLPLSSLNPAVNKIATVSFSGAPELRRSPSVTVLLLLPPPSVLKLCPRPSVLSLALLLSLRGSFFLSLCCHLLLSPTVDQRRFELELSSGARHRSPFLLLRLSWLQWLGALRGGALQLEESSRYAT